MTLKTLTFERKNRFTKHFLTKIELVSRIFYNLKGEGALEDPR